MADRPRAFFLPRTWLFVPAARPDRIRKALGLSADTVVIDLEDAVAAAHKESARDQLKGALAGSQRSNVFVRVNGLGTSWFIDDIESLDGLPLAGIVLPMTSAGKDVQVATAQLSQVSSGRWIVPLIETAAGVLAAAEIAGADPAVLALAFEAADFALDLMLPSGDCEWAALLVPRMAIVLAARAAGLAGAVDTPFQDLHDQDGLAKDAAVAASIGFAGKFAIHPDQLQAISSAFSPSEAALGRARDVATAFEAAEAAGQAALVVRDQFVDYAVAGHARAMIERAEGTTDVGRGPVPALGCGR